MGEKIFNIFKKRGRINDYNNRWKGTIKKDKSKFKN